MKIYCPSCGRGNSIPSLDCKVKCKKCLQILKVDKGIVTRVTPKNLFK